MRMYSKQKIVLNASDYLLAVPCTGVPQMMQFCTKLHFSAI